MSAFANLNLTGNRALPSVLQIEAAECGLACLAMIGQFHGYGETLAELRRRFNISMKGATLHDLIEIADKLGLAGRPLQLDIDEIAQLQTPCVLHWDMNHFVVLAKAERDAITIHDPAVGIRKLSIEEFSRHFTGIALELSPTERFVKRKARPGLGITDIAGQIRGLKPALIKLLVIALAIEVLAVLSPMFMGWVVDQVLVSSDRDLLLTLAIGFFLLLVMKTALTALRSWMLMSLKATTGMQARANLFTHLANLPTSYFETRHIGDVVARFSSQEHILEAITGEFIESVLDGLMAAVTLGLMFLLAPDLAVMVLVGALIYAAIRWLSYAPLRNAAAEQIIWHSKRETHFLETIRGIRTIKLFNGQSDRRIRWLNLAVETVNRELTLERIKIYAKTANQFVVGALVILVVWFGARHVLDGGFSVGLLFAFVSYKDQFLERVSSLIDKVVELRMLRLHADRLSDIVLSAPEKRVDELPVRVGANESIRIELKNVSFRYSEQEPWILKDINLNIEAGESVVFTGPSGGGKTTLLKLIAGLLVPTSGDILVNGMPLLRFGLVRYRAMMGVVMQDDQLFAGSIAENICFFANVPDAEFIMHCAELASVHADIEAMPMGYASLIGDMGTILSGGQKQRILIARALYREPRVLLLDEATSHLDVTNERVVNDALRAASITRIMVAHRPETIRAAEREIRLEGGTIANGWIEQLRSTL